MAGDAGYGTFVAMTARTPGPCLIFDGECGFCRRSVVRLRRWAGEEIPARPYQEVEPGFAGISCAEAERAVQYVDGEGVRYSAAAAIVEALAAHGGPRWPRWVYRHVPGVAWVAEAVYGQIARNRQVISSWERRVDGLGTEVPTYDGVMGGWVRWMGVMFAVAFISLGVQVEGLYGREGVWPMADFLRRAEVAGAGWPQVPSVFWWGAGDGVLRAVWMGGALAGLLAAAGVMQGPMLLVAWAGYLSFVAAGGPFLNFQWDALLLECGVLAMLGARWGLWTRGWGLRHAVLWRWLVWWVLFKVMFFSGVVKLASGDVAWSGLTALSYHFETQPLPNPLAWWMDQLPESVLAALCAGMFGLELVLPLAMVLGRRGRLLAAAGFTLLQVGILLTGNYGFFRVWCWGWW